MIKVPPVPLGQQPQRPDEGVRARLVHAVEEQDGVVNLPLEEKGSRQTCIFPFSALFLQILKYYRCIVRIRLNRSFLGSRFFFGRLDLNFWAAKKDM